MAYRLGPMLGAYREAALLGAIPSIPTTIVTRLIQARQVTPPIFRAGVFRSTPITIGPAPLIPISSPTVVVAPAPVPPPVIVTPSTPNVLPMAPMVPTAPGSSPMLPVTNGGGGADVTPTSSEPSAPTPGAAIGVPGWVLPAAVVGVLFLFLSGRR